MKNLKLTGILVAVLTIVMGLTHQVAAGQHRPEMAAGLGVSGAGAQRVACWMADGGGMHPTGDLEGFLADRLGASGDRVAIEPKTVHAVLRLLGLSGQSTFDPRAAGRLANAARADWIVWVKMVSRDVQSKKLLSLPYLFTRRRLDAHVFFDVRIYDRNRGAVIGSKRLKLSDRGDGTWQIGEDERLDPAYNNDAAEIHNRMRRLDWRAAAAISRYTAGLLESGGFAATTADNR